MSDQRMSDQTERERAKRTDAGTGDVVNVAALSPVDVLLAAALTVNAASNALMAIVQLCEEQGVFDAARGADLVAEAKRSGEITAQQVRDVLSRRNTNVFMRDKRQPPSNGE